jgi:hypothetical protein
MPEESIKAVMTAIQGLYNPQGTSPLNPVAVDPGLSPVKGVSSSADNFNSAIKVAGKRGTLSNLSSSQKSSNTSTPTTLDSMGGGQGGPSEGGDHDTSGDKGGIGDSPGLGGMDSSSIG